MFNYRKVPVNKIKKKKKLKVTKVITLKFKRHVYSFSLKYMLGHANIC